MKKMERISDSTDKQVGKTEQKSPEDWKKKAIYNFSSERHHPENTSEAAQERTSSPSDRNIEPDVDIPFSNRRQTERRQHWEVNRSYSGVAAASNESQTHLHRIQDSKADDTTSNTRELGQRKGHNIPLSKWGEPGYNEHFKRWHNGETESQNLDLIKQAQDRYIENNLFKD